MKRTFAVTSACSILMMAATPAIAAGNAAKTAPTLGVRSGAISRAATPVAEEQNHLAGGGIFVLLLAAVAIGAGIFFAIDGDDKPVSA